MVETRKVVDTTDKKCKTILKILVERLMTFCEDPNLTLIKLRYSVKYFLIVELLLPRRLRTCDTER